MITRLYVENFAIIQQVEVVFQNGLNIITGETGAGKSIVIEALGLALGERGNTDMIRFGEERTIVECEIRVQEAHQEPITDILRTEDISREYPLIMRRELRNNGRSRAFINDTPCTVQVLKQVGDRVVDMHGQHEHQSLLDPDTHISFLDDFAGHRDLINRVQERYRAWIDIEEEFSELRRKQRELSEKEDLYRFQLKEISAANPTSGELEELEQGRKILSNSQRIAELVHSLLERLYEGESSVYDELVAAEHELRELSQIDDSISDYTTECSSASVSVKEISNFLNKYASSIESEPGRLEYIEERIVTLRQLMKKYGPTLDDVIDYGKKTKQLMSEFENYDLDLKKLSSRHREAAMNLAKACETLHQSRLEAAKTFAGQTEDVLHRLGMDQSSFRVYVDYQVSADSSISVDSTAISASPNGADKVEFYVTTNPGEGEKPLAQIASGGEISRTMLAIKSVLAGNDEISSVIFDEIDIGISGRISRIVAEELEGLSRYHQVICITHLPQIASLGDVHFVVGKNVSNDRTTTHIRQLTSDERVREIATLVGGEHISETTLNNARELLEKSKR